MGDLAMPDNAEQDNDEQDEDKPRNRAGKSSTWK